MLLLLLSFKLLCLFYPFGFEPSAMPLPLVLASWSTSTYFWTFYFLVDFCFACFSTAISAWAKPSSLFSNFGASGMTLLGVALIDFLGNSFLTYSLLVTSATFSFPMCSFSLGFCVSFLVPFYFSDFITNDEMAGCFVSLSAGNGDNGDSSLSLSCLNSSLATFSSCFHLFIFSIVNSTSYVVGALFSNDASLESLDLVGNSIV